MIAHWSTQMFYHRTTSWFRAHQVISASPRNDLKLPGNPVERCQSLQRKLVGSHTEETEETQNHRWLDHMNHRNTPIHAHRLILTKLSLLLPLLLSFRYHYRYHKRHYYRYHTRYHYHYTCHCLTPILFHLSSYFHYIYHTYYTFTIFTINIYVMTYIQLIHVFI